MIKAPLVRMELRPCAQVPLAQQPCDIPQRLQGIGDRLFCHGQPRILGVIALLILGQIVVIPEAGLIAPGQQAGT